MVQIRNLNQYRGFFAPFANKTKSDKPQEHFFTILTTDTDEITPRKFNDALVYDIVVLVHYGPGMDAQTEVKLFTLYAENIMDIKKSFRGAWPSGKEIKLTCHYDGKWNCTYDYAPVRKFCSIPKKGQAQ
jgi:hypothetical protein